MCHKWHRSIIQHARYFSGMRTKRWSRTNYLHKNAEHENAYWVQKIVYRWLSDNSFESHMWTNHNTRFGHLQNWRAWKESNTASFGLWIFYDLKKSDCWLQTWDFPMSIITLCSRSAYVYMNSPSGFDTMPNTVAFVWKDAFMVCVYPLLLFSCSNVKLIGKLVVQDSWLTNVSSWNLRII